MSRVTSVGVKCIVAATLLAAVGCRASDPEQFRPSENLRQLAVLCGRYSGMHKGKLPANLDELKKFAKSTAGDAKDIEKLFVSPRDQEPYVFIPSGKATMPGVGAKEVMLHEKTGVGGRRYVAYTTAEIEEVDEDTFNNLLKKK